MLRRNMACAPGEAGGCMRGRPMLSAIIDVRPEPLTLTATLSPLVRGVVEGLIGTAVLVAREAPPEIAAIADAGGCRLVLAPSFREGFARAVAGSGGAGVLVLDTGIQLGAEFWPLLADALPTLGGRPAATAPAVRQGLAGGLAALATAVRLTGGGVSRDCALLLPPGRARAIAQAKADPFAERYGPALVRLRASVTRVRVE